MATPRRAANAKRTSLKGARILVVEARFYEDIADLLLKGVTRALRASDVEWDHITVPGALEIPAAMVIALDAAAGHGRPYDGAVALGCVIRGETSHYDLVSGLSARGLMELSIARGLPVGNGIITVENDAQALERARPDKLDKGGGAVEAALALVRLKRRLQRSPRGGR